MSKTTGWQAVPTCPECKTDLVVAFDAATVTCPHCRALLSLSWTWLGRNRRVKATTIYPPRPVLGRPMGLVSHA